MKHDLKKKIMETAMQLAIYTRKKPHRLLLRSMLTKTHQTLKAGHNAGKFKSRKSQRMLASQAIYPSAIFRTKDKAQAGLFSFKLDLHGTISLRSMVRLIDEEHVKSRVNSCFFFSVVVNYVY